MKPVRWRVRILPRSGPACRTRRLMVYTPLPHFTLASMHVLGMTSKLHPHRILALMTLAVDAPLNKQTKESSYSNGAEKASRVERMFQC